MDTETHLGQGLAASADVAVHVFKLGDKLLYALLKWVRETLLHELVLVVATARRQGLVRVVANELVDARLRHKTMQTTRRDEVRADRFCEGIAVKVVFEEGCQCWERVGVYSTERVGYTQL